MNEDYEVEEVAPWLLLILILAGGFLRAFSIGIKGMWLDETFSVWLANQGAGDVLQWIVKIDQHPPLYYPYEEQYAIEVVKQGVPLDLFDSGILEPKMTDADIPKLLSLVSGHDRVWLLYSHDSYTDPMGLIPQTLASTMKLIRTREFYGGQVQLYGM